MFGSHATDQELFDQYRQEVLDGPELMYVGCLLSRAAQKFPAVTALICQDESITYQDLYRRACAVSKMLHAHGIKPKDRVLVMVNNSIEFYVAYYGVMQAGAVVAPLNVFLREKELAHIIKDSNPALIIASSELSELFQKTELPLPPLLTETALTTQASDQEVTAFKTTQLPRDEMAVLLYTSGTTGFPKGVMLSSNNIITNVLQGAARFRPQAHERIFAVLPLFHSFAQNTCVWAPFVFGYTVIIVPKIERRTILKGLEHKPTVFLGVPALFGLMCLLKSASLDSVTMFASGGDAMPDKIRVLFSLIYRRRIGAGYGLTETSPVVAACLEDEIVRVDTVGRPLVGVTVSFRDEQGNERPQGEVGELWVKGPNVMLGYYNADEANKNVFSDGWFKTGDLAYMDAQGRIVIAGRIKDLIAHKGFKIYPPEVENVIMLYPNVLRVGVIGMKDNLMGEVPVAYVQVRQAEEGIEQKLKELCDKNLASYKIPRYFICSVDELPLTSTGKVDKKVLRQRVHDDIKA